MAVHRMEIEPSIQLTHIKQAMILLQGMAEKGINRNARLNKCSYYTFGVA